MIIIRGKSGKSIFARDMLKGMENPLVFAVGDIGNKLGIELIRLAEIEDCFRFFNMFKELFEAKQWDYTDVVFIANVPKEDRDTILRFEELERLVKSSVVITVQDNDIENILLSQLGGW